MTHFEIVEQKIGFDRIREKVKSKCSTEYGQKLVSNETFSTNPTEIIHRLDLTDEMRVILMFESSFPDSKFHDCIQFLTPLKREQTHIDLISLNKLKESLDTLRKVVNFFSNAKEGLYPNLKKMSTQITIFPEALRRIEEIIDKYGEIRDNASENLYNIRKSIRGKEGIISKRMQSILKSAQQEGVVDEESSISIREGRMLIPVAAGNKNKIPGIVFDHSASGKTAFIEPLEIVELNNQLKELYFEEQGEIIKILLNFTDFLRPYLPELIASSEYMGELDFIKAKGYLALEMGGGKCIISQGREERIKNGRHPILEYTLKKEGKQIVPLDLTLTAEKRILLISGPNAGGKSVCLKTIGILQYMLQWGLLTPCSEASEMAIFDNIFIDIGDGQSIDNDLSTYSSHLNNMKELLSKATSQSLILIDEFGSGTEPAAGGAIAEEILSTLEKMGCFAVITTHYTNLKFYANNSNGAINGAMQFDVQKIEPLFKLEIGLPGSSFAFELARKIGLPESIVHGAEVRAGTEYVNIERNLKKIARNKRQLEERLAKIKSTDKTLENITDKYEKELGDIRELRKSIIEQAKQEAKEILDTANRKIEATIKEIKENQAAKEKTKEARKELEDFTNKIKEDKSEFDAKIEKKMEQIIARKQRQQERKIQREKKQNLPQESTTTTPKIKEEKLTITIGAKVKIKESNLVGEVVQIYGKNITIAVGEILSKMSIEKVEAISSSEYKKNTRPAPVKSTYSSSSISDRKLNFKPSIDIRGKRLDEAIEIVTRFIDDAFMIGMNEVTILHGKGNGILREEIRKYLKITPGVASFRDEHIERGGTGITIVTLDN